MHTWAALVIGAIGVCLAAPIAEAPPYIFTQPIPAQTVILHFVPDRELSEQCGDRRATACSKHWRRHLGPWAELSEPEQLCEVWLPAQRLIAAVPGRLTARFVDPRMSIDLAHEVLHCSIGAWHPTLDMSAHE